MDRWHYVAGGLALGVGAFWWVHRDDPGTLVEQLVNWSAYVVTRGRRLTRTAPRTAEDLAKEGASQVPGVGDIAANPRGLASDAAAVVGAPVSLDEYALARMLASEEGTSSSKTKVAIAWVAANEAARRGLSVSALLLADKGPGDGFFGEQRGRYASTRTDPYEGDLQIATDVLSGVVDDITSGAVHFYRPALQDRLYAAGKTSKSAADIAAAWGDGYTIDGTDEGIVFFA